MNATNTFQDGLIMDSHPLATPNNVLTNCLNGTLITYNGNELILQNDVGNSKIPDGESYVKLKDGFIPIGLKEFGGILYIFSVNPNEFESREILDVDYNVNDPHLFKEGDKYYKKYYKSEIGTFPSPDYSKTSGKLLNKYQPLRNYVNGNYNTWDKKTKPTSEFTTCSLNFDVNHPLTIDCQKSYDGSINLIFTDNKNIPRLINTRFSLYGDNEYEIVDRTGDKDTNIYFEDDFEYSTSLHKIVNSIVDIKFNDVYNNGNLKVGTYTFYFTLADSDDNESDFIGQSGIVTCYKGNINDPFSIDGGLEDENSNKSISFTLSNIPRLFSRVYVYYSRNSSDASGNALTTFKKIKDYYNVIDSESDIVILNDYNTIDIDKTTINTNYTIINTAKTQAINLNILFFGNIQKTDSLYKELENFSHTVYPKLIIENVGMVNPIYDIFGDKYHLGEYYNVHNIYHRVGYWPSEIYRFGIVYILEDYSCSPVFNILGVKELTENILLSSVDNYLNNLSNKNRVDLNFNLFGISQITYNKSLFSAHSKDSESDYTKTLGILFIVPELPLNLKNKIKGYFFVRLKRLKITLALGIVIGFDKDFSRLPVLYNTGIYIQLKDTHPPTHYRIRKLVQIILGADAMPTEVTTYKVYFYHTTTIIEKKDDEEKEKLYHINNSDKSSSIFDYFTEEELLSYTFDTDGYTDYLSITESLLSKYQTINLEVSTSGLSDYFTLSVLSVTDNEKNWQSIKLLNSKDEISQNIVNLVPWSVIVNSFGNKYSISEDLLLTYPYKLTITDSAVKGNLVKLLPSIIYQKYSVPIHDLEQYDKKRGSYWDIFKSTIERWRNNPNTRPKNSVTNEALIVPEYFVNLKFFNSLFTSSDFDISINGIFKIGGISNNFFIYYDFTPKTSSDELSAYLLAVPEDTEAIKCKKNIYSSRAGNASDVTKFKVPFTNTYLYDVNKSYKTAGPGEIKDKNIFSKLNLFSPIVRGIWSLYVGAEFLGIEPDVYSLITIKIKTNSTLEDLFLQRKQDSSEYYPISQRFDFNKNNNNVAFGGDCFVCNFTQRMNRNFQDPSFPTNEEIAWPYCTNRGLHVNLDDLPIATFSTGGFDTHYFPKSEMNLQMSDTSLINRSDVNAVKLGHWITVKVMSSTNLSIRSTDGSNITERATTNLKRSFYPLLKPDTGGSSKIPESNIQNGAYEKSLGELIYTLLEEVPALKTNFSNRIVYSDLAIKDSYINNFRTFRKTAFLDYTRQYGEIVKLLNYYDGYLLCIFEHAVALITVNEKSVATLSESGFSYITTANVLSDTPKFLSTEYGSLWADSVIQTATGVYGIDTVAKKIWHYGETFEVLSDLKLLKFLKDNLDLNELETEPDVTKLSVKSHYNKHKQDVMFTFFKVIDDDFIGWNICYNEITKKFTTFYSWIPSYSGNINNTYYSFNNENSINMPKPEILESVENVEVKYCYDYYPENTEIIIEDDTETSNIQKVKLTVDGVDFNMIKVKGGSFTNKYPENSLNVTVSDYWISETPVTRELYKAVIGDLLEKTSSNDVTKYYTSSQLFTRWSDDTRTNLPANFITERYHVPVFLELLNSKLNGNFDLPTHAQWTYAALGGQYSKGYEFAGSNDPDKVAWSIENCSEIQPVATKAPNELGLYDMSGNVWEWCKDGLSFSYNGNTLDPIVPRASSVQSDSLFVKGGGIAEHAYFSENSNVPEGYTREEWDEKQLRDRDSFVSPLSVLYPDGAYLGGSSSFQIGFRIVCKELPSDTTTEDTNKTTYTVNGISFNMINVEGGTFTMGATEEQGSDMLDFFRPTHQVTLSDYRIADTEVTQELWQVIMGENTSTFKNNLNPVEGITWLKCQIFIDSLNKLTGLQFRLPTEAEWEYAARGGNQSKGYKYAGGNNLDEVAWHSGNSETVPHNVATKAPNELGLYDMSGNVWEWCQDWSANYTDESLVNPQGPDTGTRKTIRGGAFVGSEIHCRVSYRSRYQPDSGSLDIGFRLAMSGTSSVNNTITKTTTKTTTNTISEALLTTYELIGNTKQNVTNYSGENAKTKYKELTSKEVPNEKELGIVYKVGLTTRVVNKYVYSDDMLPNFLWEHNKENNWCNWYDEQHPFEFEFVVADNPQVHKIFNNLKMIANKTLPESFHYEVVGEVYDFKNDKPNMYYRLEKTKLVYSDNYPDDNLGYDKSYKNKVTPKRNPKSAMFPLTVSHIDKKNKIYDTYQRLTSNQYDYQSMSGSEIVYDNSANEFDVATHIKAYPIDGFEWQAVCGTDESNATRLKQYYLNHNILVKEENGILYKKIEYGRRLGNCHYDEDNWEIQIPSINYAEKNENWTKEPPINIAMNPIPEDILLKGLISVPADVETDYWGSLKQTRIRDKYVRIRVRYTGDQLAIISAIITQYKESYS